MKISSASDRDRRNKLHQAIGGLFFEDRIHLHTQTGKDDDGCKGYPSWTVDNTLVPDIRIGHTSTEHKEQTKANQSATNTHIEIVLLMEKQRKGLHIAGVATTTLGLNIC